MKRIAIACDHAGWALKSLVKSHLEDQGFVIRDFGTDSDIPVDYPDFIRPAARSVSIGESDLGILIGGSGNGECMVANKVSGVRCALCWNEKSARLAKAHNDANMIAIGARMVSAREAFAIADTWLMTTFAGGRHIRRIAKIEA